MLVLGGPLMPIYRLRYVCETSLQFHEDISLESQGGKALFLFSQKEPTGNTVRLLVEVEGADYRGADVKAQSVIQPALDALSFSTGSPLLVLHWDFIIKGEKGSKARRAIWCEKRAEPAPLVLTQKALDEARQILKEEEESGLELCWHRYAIQRNLVLDRFVFQWLAFEGLAGKKQIPTVCSSCKKEVTHCEKALVHEGSDSHNAHQLFVRVEPDTTIGDFKREIWGRSRNAVFHGSKYPSPKFLLGLNSLSPKLRKACDTELNKRYKLEDRLRPTQDIDLHTYRYNMFEWQTAKAEKDFAEDFPWEPVTKEFGNMRSGEVRSADFGKLPFRLLDFVKDSPGW
jgi:hypothetical protein